MGFISSTLSLLKIILDRIFCDINCAERISSKLFIKWLSRKYVTIYFNQSRSIMQLGQVTVRKRAFTWLGHHIGINFETFVVLGKNGVSFVV